MGSKAIIFSNFIYINVSYCIRNTTAHFTYLRKFLP